jgi:Zn-dependent M28 family amino/carboxypeptidase
MRLLLCFLAAGALLVAASVESKLRPAFSSITPERLLEHIKVLSSDEFAGRAPGSDTESKTINYLIAQCRDMGLKPGNPDGTFTQSVPLWAIRSTGSMNVRSEKGALTLEAGKDYTLSSSFPKPEISISDAPLVFAGYGVVAPEYQWDDYKDVDVKGKVLVLLSGDPPVPDASDPAKLDEKIFEGRALSYYGRPATKYETAYTRGAVAVITVFTPRSGATSLARFAQNAPRETMILRDEADEKRISAQASLTPEKAQELLALSGQNLAALRTASISRDFRPVDLGASVSIEVKNETRKVDSPNVVALLNGSDPSLRNEYVIYTGHWDHVGKEGDRIYHGASDNASGTAGVLELARAFTKIRHAPKRSVLFMWPTAEEKGLLGARYYVHHPLYPLKSTVANINLDYFSNWGWGRTHDISIVGLGNSSLDDLVVQAAREQHRVVTGDTDPEEGFFFRSDHLEFAMGSVPSLETSPGIDHIGKPAGFGVQKRTEYIRNDYHKPTDQIKPDWDLRGAVEDLQVLLEVGYRAAENPERPTWKARPAYMP